MTPAELRALALELAVESSPYSLRATDDVVSRAEKFYAFLSGTTRGVVELKLGGSSEDLTDAIVRALRRKVRESGGDVGRMLS